MSEIDDISPQQARTPGAAVLIAGESPDGEAISAALRAREFETETTPLALAEARIAAAPPLVAILDVDEPGAALVVERVHRLPGCERVTLLLIGDPARAGEIDPQIIGQIFPRPVDLAELAAHVASVVEPARPRSPRETTPPPSYTPPRPPSGRPPSARPGVMDSDAPSGSDFPGELEAMDVGSVIPGDGGDDPAAQRLSPARISPELEQLLAAAEQRVIGGARPSSVPSADDDADLMLSADLLAALDEPLEPDDEEGGTGEAVIAGTPAHGSASRAGTDAGRLAGSRSHTGTSGITGAIAAVPPERAAADRAARAPEPAAAEPAELTPWSRGAHSGRGVWAQASPFRGPGAQAAADSRRERTDPHHDEPSQGAALTLKQAPSADPSLADIRGSGSPSAPSGSPSAPSASSADPRSLSPLTTPDPRSFPASAEPRSPASADRPPTRRTGLEDRPSRPGGDRPSRPGLEAALHDRPPQTPSDEERWAAGTRDEGEARRDEIEEDLLADARFDGELDGGFGTYSSGGASPRGLGVPGAPLVSPPRDVRVRTFSEAPGTEALLRRAPEPPRPPPEPPLPFPAHAPPPRPGRISDLAPPPPLGRAAPISDLAPEPRPGRVASISDLAPEPRGGRIATISDLAPAPEPPRGPSISDFPPALPVPRAPIAPVEAHLPVPPLEEPPPSRAAPEITVLGPGDAPRALARAVGGRISGSMAITTEAGTRRIVLHEGDLVTAASEIPDEALLAYLAARGDITRDVAARLTGKLPASGRHAGAALIAHGHLGQDDLWPVLRAHAEWIIGQVTLIEGGTCELEEEPPGRLKAEPNVFGGATGAEVFVETIRRVIAPDVALRRLGGPAARLDDGVRRALIGECALRADEEELVRCSRGRAIAEVIDATESDVATLLYALVCLEVLDVLIPPSLSEAPRAPAVDPLDEEAIRQRVRARLALVQDGDYFAVLGISRDATSYEIRRAYLTLRRAFEPSRLLTGATVDLLDDVRLVIEVLDEAYEILREPHRRERYRRAIEAMPP